MHLIVDTIYFVLSSFTVKPTRRGSFCNAENAAITANVNVIGVDEQHETLVKDVSRVY